MGEIGSWEDFKKHHLIVETYMNDVDEVNGLLRGRKKNFNKEGRRLGIGILLVCGFAPVQCPVSML